MNSPQISVVMPVYNTAEFLSESIESVLNQSFIDFEFIIVDDGSTDNSMDILKKYSDERINIIYNNHDFINSCNKSVTAAKGKYIARMDSDDIMVSNRLFKQFHFMESHPEIDICGAWLKMFGMEDRLMQPPLKHFEIISQMLLGSSMCHATTIMKRDVLYTFPKVNGVYQFYNKNYSCAEDYKLWIDLINKGYIFANIPEILHHYRRIETQTTQKKEKELVEYTIKIQHEYLEYVTNIINESDEIFNNFLNESISLCNNELITFYDLIIIINIIYSRYLKSLYRSV